MNASVVVVGIITGPLQARALGPSGRGDLAAVLTPLGVLPTLASLGLGSYAIRAAARGERPGTVMGSLFPVMLLLSLLIAGAAPFIADLLAGDRDRVNLLITLGLILFPIGMLSTMLVDVATGLEEWGPVTTTRLIPPLLQLIAIPVLFVTGHLTVTTAACIGMVAAPMLIVPVVPILRRSLPLKFKLDVLRAGISFGLRAWIGGLSKLMNARLDQLLMIRLVPSSELGLYAVAVTISTFFVGPVVGAITTAALPRMSRGDQQLSLRLTRMTLAGAAVAAATIGAMSPVVLHVLFGPPFVAALPMVALLLVAGIPVAGAQVLSTALSGHGRPGISTLGQLLGLAITIPGLLVVLGPLGGVGAAFVSVVAYTANFLFVLVFAKREFGGRWRHYLLVDRADVRLLRDVAEARLRRVARKLSRTP